MLTNDRTKGSRKAKNLCKWKTWKTLKQNQSTEWPPVKVISTPVPGPQQTWRAVVRQTRKLQLLHIHWPSPSSPVHKAFRLHGKGCPCPKHYDFASPSSHGSLSSHVMLSTMYFRQQGQRRKRAFNSPCSAVNTCQ